MKLHFIDYNNTSVERHIEAVDTAAAQKFIDDGIKLGYYVLPLARGGTIFIPWHRVLKFEITG